MSEQPKQLSVVSAAFLGIGAMVGAGIFALLGEAALVLDPPSGSPTPKPQTPPSAG